MLALGASEGLGIPLQRRLSVINEANTRIGTTLDTACTACTAQELADVATDRFADLVTVDLLDSALQEGGVVPTHVARRSVGAPSNPCWMAARTQQSAPGKGTHIPRGRSLLAHWPLDSPAARHRGLRRSAMVGGFPGPQTCPADLRHPLSAPGPAVGPRNPPGPRAVPPPPNRSPVRRRGSAPGPRDRVQSSRVHRQRPSLRPRTFHGAHAPAQLAPAPGARTVRRRDRLPLPALRIPGRRGRRLVRRDSAVRCPRRTRHHGPPADGRPYSRGHRPDARRTAHPPR